MVTDPTQIYVIDFVLCPCFPQDTVNDVTHSIFKGVKYLGVQPNKKAHTQMYVHSPHITQLTHLDLLHRHSRFLLFL